MKVLDLLGTHVSDAGLEYLEGLKGLESLDLTKTQVTDAGLEHLKELKRLQWLILTGTQMTNARKAALNRALPGCHIVW